MASDFDPSEFLTDEPLFPSGSGMTLGTRDSALIKKYQAIAEREGLSPDPFDPRHHYDYMAALRDGAEPDASGHWPSKYKTADHPNRYVDGVDTISGQAFNPEDFLTDEPLNGGSRSFWDNFSSLPNEAMNQLAAVPAGLMRGLGNVVGGLDALYQKGASNVGVEPGSQLTDMANEQYRMAGNIETMIKQPGQATKTIQSLTQSAPSITASAISLPVGMAVTGAQEIGSLYKEFIDKGFDPERSFTGALSAAAVNTPIEYASNRFQIGNIKKLAQSLGLSTAVADKAFAAVWNVIKGGAGEGLESSAQTIPTEAARQYSANEGMSGMEALKAALRDPELVSKMKEEGGQGALAGALLAGAGGVVGAPFQDKDAKTGGGGPPPTMSPAERSLFFKRFGVDLKPAHSATPVAEEPPRPVSTEQDVTRQAPSRESSVSPEAFDMREWLMRERNQAAMEREVARTAEAEAAETAAAERQRVNERNQAEIDRLAQEGEVEGQIVAPAEKQAIEQEAKANDEIERVKKAQADSLAARIYEAETKDARFRFFEKAGFKVEASPVESEGFAPEQVKEARELVRPIMESEALEPAEKVELASELISDMPSAPSEAAPSSAVPPLDAGGAAAPITTEPVAVQPEPEAAQGQAEGADVSNDWRKAFDDAENEYEDLRQSIKDDPGLVASPNVVLMNVRSKSGGNPTKLALPYDGTREDALRVAKVLKRHAGYEYDASNQQSEIFATDANGAPILAFMQGEGTTEAVDVNQKAAPPKLRSPAKATASVTAAIRDLTADGGLANIPAIREKTGLSNDEIGKAIDSLAKGGKVFIHGDADTGAQQDAKLARGDVVKAAGEVVAGVELQKEATPEPAKTRKTKAPRGNNTLYANPLPEMARLYTEKIGTPLWDGAALRIGKQLLEKVPVVGPAAVKGIEAIERSIRRTMDENYRGDLTDQERYADMRFDVRRDRELGAEYAVDLGNRLNALPIESQLNIGAEISGKTQGAQLTDAEKALVDETRAVYDRLWDDLYATDVISEELYTKHKGQPYMPRLFLKFEKGGKGEANTGEIGVKNAKRYNLDRIKSKKDLPQELLDEFKEILTPGYPVAKGIAQLTHTVAMAKHFQGISTNPDWAMPRSDWSQEGAEVPDGFVQLPDSARLGPLRAAYVHPEIYKELNDYTRDSKAWERAWGKFLGTWKANKVLLDPGVQLGNILSSSTLLHLGGVPYWSQAWNAPKNFREMREKGPMYQEAKQAGTFIGNYGKAELNDLFQDVVSQMEGPSSADSLLSHWKALDDAVQKLKKAGKKPGELYSAVEDFFKLQAYTHYRSEGMTPKEASAEARKWGIDYGDVSRNIAKFRKSPLGSPFVTFSIKAIPRLAEAAIKTPWRFAVATAPISALSWATLDYFGEDDEEAKAKKKLAPDWIKDSSALPGGVFPTFYRVPIVDGAGREYYVNLGRFFPWGNITEDQGSWFKGVPSWVSPLTQPGVKDLIENVANRDLFTGNEIVSEADLAGKSGMEQLKTQLAKRGAKAARAWLPGGLLRAEKAYDQLYGPGVDYRGRSRPDWMAQLEAVGGPKFYAVDYNEQAARKMSEVSPDRSQNPVASKLYNRAKIAAAKKNVAEKMGKPTKIYDDQIAEIKEQLAGLTEQAKELGNDIKKVRSIGK